MRLSPGSLLRRYVPSVSADPVGLALRLLGSRNPAARSAFGMALGGMLLSLYALVWFLVRTIKGLVLLNDRKAYPNPGSWGF